MVAAVIQLAARRPAKEVNERIVSLLGRMLADAESGTLVGIAGFIETQAGDVTFFGLGSAAHQPDRSIRHLTELAEEFIP